MRRCWPTTPTPAGGPISITSVTQPASAATMFIGPSMSGEPLEIGVVADDEGTAIIHAMRARPKFLQGWWTP